MKKLNKDQKKSLKDLDREITLRELDDLPCFNKQELFDKIANAIGDSNLIYENKILIGNGQMITGYKIRGSKKFYQTGQSTVNYFDLT